MFDCGSMLHRTGGFRLYACRRRNQSPKQSPDRKARVTTRRPADDTAPAPSVGAKPHREGRSEAVRRRREAEELRVLQMLEQGKISSQEAAELIAALQGMSFNRGDDTPAEDPSDAEPVEPVHPGPFA